MPENAYDRLRFLDNSFLMMETPTSPMQVAGTATFEVEVHRQPVEAPMRPDSLIQRRIRDARHALCRDDTAVFSIQQVVAERAVH